MMKSTAFALCLVALAAPAVASPSAPPTPPQPAHAKDGPDDAERLALALAFADATLSEDHAVAEFRLAAMTGLEASLARQAAEPTHLAIARETLEELLREAEPTVRRRAPAMSAAYARVYASEFTAAELRDMVAFARTSGGRRYLARAGWLDQHPEITAQSDLLAAELEPILAGLQVRMCKRLAATRLAANPSAKCPRA
jgi:hypothetical protein